MYVGLCLVLWGGRHRRCDEPWQGAPEYVEQLVVRDLGWVEDDEHALRVVLDVLVRRIRLHTVVNEALALRQRTCTPPVYLEAITGDFV